jgi:hypothetical protein
MKRCTAFGMHNMHELVSCGGEIPAEIDTEYNDAPSGWREISEEEFAKSSFFTYSFRYTETKQIRCLPQYESMLAVRLFYMRDHTGYGMAHDYWGGRIRYFRFGCVHKWKELSQKECGKRSIGHHGRCFHVEECSECKHVRSYDSGD